VYPVAKGKKPKVRTMDMILLIIAVALAAFTLEMIDLYRETGAIPDTLCTCVFGALAGECGAMAWIKTTKDRRTERAWQLQDEARAEEKQQRQNNPKE
jgi:hypothetical protein